MSYRFCVLTIVGVLGVLAAAPSVRAANCALRNPDRQIYEIFPDATSYRTIVANVDERVKPIIEAALGSAISFNDLAKHTIYVVLKNDVPIGFIHPRSESGKHGTVELVWALDLDLRIRDFRVQRCREKHGEVIASVTFRDALIGHDHREIRELLLQGNKRAGIAKLGAPSEADSIVHTAVLCGAKTLIITEAAFSEQVSPLRLLGNAHRFFPQASTVTKLGSPLGEIESNAVHALLGSPLRELSAESIVAARALDAQGRLLGTVVRCRCKALGSEVEMWCAVTSDGVLNQIVPVGHADEGTRTALSALHEKTLNDLRKASTDGEAAVRRFAVEILALLQVLGAGK